LAEHMNLLRHVPGQDKQNTAQSPEEQTLIFRVFE
jgi:hypothetical protein